MLDFLSAQRKAATRAGDLRHLRSMFSQSRHRLVLARDSGDRPQPHHALGRGQRSHQDRAYHARAPRSATATRRSAGCSSNPTGRWAPRPRAASACCRRSTTSTPSPTRPTRSTAIVRASAVLGRLVRRSLGAGASRWSTNRRSASSTRRSRRRRAARCISTTSAICRPARSIA